MSLSLISILLFPFITFSDCDPGNISILNISPAVIDFRLTNQVLTTFQVLHQPFTGSDSCYFFNDLDYGVGSGFLDRQVSNISVSGSAISFNSYSVLPANNNNIIRIAEEAGQNSHVIYNSTPFSPSVSAQTQARTFISELDIVPVNSEPGIYTESLIFRLRARPIFPLSGDFSSFPVVDTRAVQFIYEIPKTLDVSIVNQGGSFDVNSTSRLISFSKLESGSSISSSVFIQTNVGYRLSLSSSNDGVLKHISTSATVPYILNLDGSIVDLSSSSSSPVEVSSNASSSPATGFNLPLSVTIGSLVGNEIGGRYSDIISLSIQAF